MAVLWYKIVAVIMEAADSQFRELRLLDIDEEDGFTHAVQYHAPDIKLYEEYLEKHADTMRKKGMDKWGDKFIAFRSVMEVVY